jgi:two-component system, LytTR family, sensor kinase
MLFLHDVILSFPNQTGKPTAGSARIGFRPTPLAVRHNAAAGADRVIHPAYEEAMKPVMDEDEPRSVSPLLALYSILGFWLFYMVVVTLRSFVIGWEAQGELAFRRGIVTLIGIVLTWGLYLILRRFDGRSLPTRVITAFVVAVPCAVIIALANYYVFNVYEPSALMEDVPAAKAMMENEQLHAAKEIAEVAISRYFFLAAWAALYLALSYAGEVRRAERRAARYEQAAQKAELRSLRYQVNPHFLFNTLNSLSSLIMMGRNEDAEAMILNLSHFYRNSLTGDPLDDVPLSEEVALQKLYLEIEAVRFPERLVTRIDIPKDLMRACVPGLILQPLVENAIKYGVSRATRPVTITISAQEKGGNLHLTVSDDGDAIPGDGDKGNGIGLANVRDRLAARFGEGANIQWYRVEGNGFTVELSMPIIANDC